MSPLKSLSDNPNTSCILVLAFVNYLSLLSLTSSRYEKWFWLKLSHLGTTLWESGWIKPSVFIGFLWCCSAGEENGEKSRLPTWFLLTPRVSSSLPLHGVVILAPHSAIMDVSLENRMPGYGSSDGFHWPHGYEWPYCYWVVANMLVLF